MAGFNFGDTANMRTTAEIGMREDNIAMAGGGLSTLSDALMQDWMLESKAAALEKHTVGKENRANKRSDQLNDRAVTAAKEKGVLEDAKGRSEVYKGADGKTGMKKEDLKAMQSQWKEEVGNLPAVEDETIKIESHYAQMIDDIDVDGIDWMNQEDVKTERDRLEKERDATIAELRDSRSFDTYKAIKLGGSGTVPASTSNTKSRLEELRAKAGK